MRLRRSSVGGPGFRRVRRGRGFSYIDGQREPVDDPEVLARIEALVIPPAWKNVWICPHPSGHIQAVGTDAAGRRQYLYHEKWQTERAEEKYDRTLTLAKCLPDWRARIIADLRGRGLGRDRVLAVAQHLIDRGYFRAGGEEYAQENGSFGLATLLRDHVQVHRDSVAFDYPAKNGVRQAISLDDPLIIRAVRSLLRAETRIPRLLVYRTSDGWHEVRADDLNSRFRELVGDEFSVKDLRTWHGTVLAAEAFATASEPTSKTARRREEAAVMRAVAEELGNTPAVARGSYVDPRVVTAYEQGITIAPALRRVKRERTALGRQHLLERATARIIKRVDRG
ncbi:DNA topoisomerase IB [Mycobacterium shimoidei]|uniref:DNA topoisomerase IB n=1 Tax=Mycobacterium shimoidei TaxID=29313 RepID=UPI0008484DEC|nr:DNA topoisomerase IB [Mycobacterium shimoidei]MCV7258987.1 DNA topoisomerase IB [Mycobacterium shimoidei]ODR11583.1 DNA topoisomerase [Mycobacterium shimoidei]ORW76804.1 DNA topoisomerase [Mycobacterium shimoidei]